MDDTLLSIIIPAYNVEKYIKTTLEIYADATIEKKQESIENFSKIWLMAKGVG